MPGITYLPVASITRALADAFSGDGHRVTPVADGRSGIDRASTDRFDVDKQKNARSLQRRNPIKC